MRFIKSMIVFFVSLCLWLMNFNGAAYGQITAKIELSGNKKQVKETKKLLGNYDFYFILGNEVLEAKYTNDNLLVIDSIGNEQIEQLKNQEFLLTRFYNEKSCLYSLLPNGFFYYEEIPSFRMYESTKTHKFIGKERRRFALNFSHNYKGTSRNVPLSLIPCSEYNGEYDNGLESFLDSLRK